MSDGTPIIVAKIEEPVVIANPLSLPPPAMATAVEPKTTEEEQRITAGQRTINKLWEMTQAIIAIQVITAMVLVCVVLIFKSSSEITTVLAALQLLSNASFLIVGFYFSRTNHTKTGGVGSEQVGR